MKSAMTSALDRRPLLASTRPPRLPRLDDEAGFGLIEGIATAVVLALLALGVLAGIDGAASSAGREKARAVAAALAEQDQERLHAMRAVDLPELFQRREVNVGGTVFTVTSEASWFSDATGAPVSWAPRPSAR